MAARNIQATWCHFPHEADIGVCGTGATVAEAFEQVAVAMTAVITEASIAELVCVEIECEAMDPDLLLVEWLNALVFEMATKAMLFGRFTVQINHNHLLAKAWGEPLDRLRHQPVVEVKGATYTELSVRQACDGSWCARCVVDV
jgi:tRNA nucleotidyltransferase (CCA-adding enzyme)